MINKKRSTFYLLLILITSCFISYTNSLQGSFLWDDEWAFEENPVIRSWGRVGDVFLNNMDETSNHLGLKYYRPMFILSGMIDYTFWELNPFGFHLTNILMHLVVVLLIFFLVFKLSRNKALAFISSLLFCVHPVHTEVVSYISGRSDSLATIFILTSLLTYIYYVEKKVSLFLSLSVISFTLALFSKDNAIIVLPLIIVYHFTFKKPFKPYQVWFLTLSVLALLFLVIRYSILPTPASNAHVLSTILERVPGVFVAVNEYIRLLIIPTNLHISYGNLLFEWHEPRAVLGIIFSLVFIAMLSVLIKRNSILGFFGLFSLISFIPVSGIYPIYGYMAEHYLYLPSIGFFVFISYVVLYVIRQYPKLTKLIYIALFIHILTLSWLTINQNKIWNNPISLFSNALRNRTPELYRMTFNLAHAYQQSNDFVMATFLYKKAMRLNPGNADPINQLASIEIKKKNKKKALALLQKVIKRDPDQFVAHNNLGTLYLEQGKPLEAIPYLYQAVQLKPENADFWNNLGVAYQATKQYMKSQEAFLKSIHLDPTNKKALNNLGVLYLASGYEKDGIYFLAKSNDLDPNKSSTLLKLAKIYEEKGKGVVSLKLYQQALLVYGRDEKILSEIKRLSN